MTREEARPPRRAAVCVVSREEPLRHDYLTEVFGPDPEIEVVLDRRRSDRRQVDVPAGAERRQAERRVRSVASDLEAFGWALVWQTDSD